MHVTPLAAHFFALYFAVISSVTPPIALASLAATGIAKGNFWKTALIGVKLCFSGYVIPFIAVYNPVILLDPASEEWPLVLVAIFMLLICLGPLIFNFFLTAITKWQRLAYMAAVLSLLVFCFTHDNYLFIIGALLFSGLMLLEWIKLRSVRLNEGVQV
jgi:TRAP-type uncharacterized transport system fused permease subunit